MYFVSYDLVILHLQREKLHWKPQPWMMIVHLLLLVGALEEGEAAQSSSMVVVSNAISSFANVSSPGSKKQNT